MKQFRYTRWLFAACVAAGLVSMVGAPLEAQNPGTVTGVVRSAEGLPLASAQVYLEGTGIGGLTNQAGRYLLLRVPAGTYTVVAEVIGFTTQRRAGVVVVEGGSVTVDFTLRTQVLGLAGLVVTGVTQATSRAMIPFTVERVSAADIVVPPANAFLAIEGKVAGARVIRGSEPGAGVNILMRTPTSVNRSTSPLMVVDGVILAESSADISTLDIESIEVVKGAAAASLYGSRAASGVIQIRTKRGSALPEDRTRFTLRSEYGASDIPNPIETAKYHNYLTNAQGQYLDSKGAVVPRWLAATTKYGFMDQEYTTQTWDHIKSLFRPNDFYTNSGTFGYNTGTTSWLATVSNQHEMGVVRGNEGYKRSDFRLNLDHRLRNDVSLSLSAFHMRSVTDNMYGNVFFDFVQIAPDVDLLQPDPDGTKYVFQPDPSGIRPNPLYLIVTQDRKAKRLRTMGSADLRYSPLEWLSVDLNASYDRSDRRNTTFIPKGVKTYDYGAGNPGYASQSSGLDDAINASAGVSASHNFGRLNTRTTARAIMESDNYQFFSASGDDMAVGGIPDLDALKIPAISSEEEEIGATGYLANTDLSWGERYIVNALVRADGSSLFGPEDRWHTYYRTSAAWRMAGEPWWPFDDINEFKLRFSRGTAGGRPNFADQYEVFNVLAGGGLSLATLGNRSLRPEHSAENEIGLDIVARQRFFLQLNYVTQKTTDQLVQVPLPALYGFTSQWQNAGTLEGHTYEASLEARLVDREGLLWTMTAVADRSRNKLVEYDRPCHTDDLGYRCAGEQIGMIYTQRLLRSVDDLTLHRGGLHANSSDAFQVNDDGLLVPVGVGNSWRDGVAKDLWGKTITIDGRSYTWGMPFKLLNEGGNAVLEKTGDFNPDFKWGITNSVQWKDLTLYALVDGQVGGDVYNATKQRMYQWERHGEEVQVGKPDEAKKPSAYYVSSLYNAASAIDWFVEDGSYVKLREVSLRYRLNPSLLGRFAPANLDRIVVSLIARNLYTWTDYSGWDPDIGSAMYRYDSFDYPVYRTLTASVEIVF
ncbi:MAG: SusC/RagA family TonB-linked outer membrane protein [Longimicrobiales bacterium]|nr:SusC/RagA family TonB-linked outer membrane protein [Longimicrobiales bacterium]